MKMGYGKLARAVLWAATAMLLAAAMRLYAPTGQSVPVTLAPSGIAGQGQSAVLDINAAGTDALEELPGIGPALAERIVLARAENGPFDGPDALMDVPGIGPATWEQIAPFVYFGK